MPVISSQTAMANFLTVCSFKTVPITACDLPPRNLYTLNFDESVGQVGQVVQTRIETTQFGSSLNNLANGWGNLQPSSSLITASLQAQGLDHPFNLTTFDTVGEAQILNTFAGMIQKQVANGIFMALANQVTSSNYPYVCYVSSSSAFNLTNALNTSALSTVSTGLQSVGTLLDELEIPQADRYCLLNPAAYQGLISQVYQTYVLGNDRAVVGNGFVADTMRNQAWPGLDIAGFDVFKHPRINSNTAKTPYGGVTYSGGNVLAGFAGAPMGMVLAARSLEIGAMNTPLSYALPVVEPTSGFPLTYMMALDLSLPAWRLGVYSLFGTAVGNTNAVVPIISLSI